MGATPPSSYPSFETQLSFLNWEMGTGNGGNIASTFNNNPNMSVSQAAIAFERQFERSGGSALDRRINNANSVYAASQTGTLSSISPNVSSAFNYLTNQGYTPQQASGIVGNLMAESGSSLDPTAFNPAGGGNGAVGIAQWRADRLDNVLNWDGEAIVPNQDYVPEEGEAPVVEDTESAAAAVNDERRSTGRRSPSFYQPNVLNSFDTYTYNWAIHVVHPQTADRMEENLTNGTAITLAETGVENELSIESVMQQMATNFSSSNVREALSHTFQITLQEVNGFTYFNRIKLAMEELGIESITDVNYLLELNFRGWNQDGSTISGNSQQSSLGPYYYICAARSVDTKNEGGVTTYTLALEGTTSKVFNRLPYHLKSDISFTASNFGEFLDNFQEDVNKETTDQVATSPGATLADRYVFKTAEAAEAWREWRFDIPDANNARNITSSSSTGQTSFNFPSGTGMSDAIAQALYHTREFKNLPTAKNRFAKEKPDELPPANRMADLLQWFTFKTSVRYGAYDQLSKRYQVEYTYEVSPYIAPEAIHDPESYNELFNNQNLGQERLSNIFNNGLMKKRYDYTYTGENTEIYNLDMTFNTSYFILQPIHGGAIQDTSGMFPGQGEVTLLKGEYNEIKRRLADIRSSIQTLEARRADIIENLDRFGPFGSDLSGQLQELDLELGNLRDDQSTSVRQLESVEGQLEEATRRLTAQGFENSRAGIGNAAQRYITQTDLYNRGSPNSTLNDRSQELTFDYKNPTGALSVDGSDNETNIGSAQLGALELNLLSTSDMTEINLHIRGDPYWLGKPFGALQNNNAQADYDIGGVGYFLNTRFPTYDGEDGFINQEFTDFMMTAVYRVKYVQATYMNGEFKMMLDSFRDANINTQQLLDQLAGGYAID